MKNENNEKIIIFKTISVTVVLDINDVFRVEVSDIHDEDNDNHSSRKARAKVSIEAESGVSEYFFETRYMADELAKLIFSKLSGKHPEENISEELNAEKKISMKAIVAVDANYGIGYKNGLLFKCNTDMKRFKELTIGHTVIMGRKTFESLPNLLENRRHIIFTRDKYYKIPERFGDDHENIIIINDLKTLEDTLEKDISEIWVIGGAEIYNLLMGYIDELYVTMFHTIKQADTFFPADVLDNEFTIKEISGPCYDVITYLSDYREDKLHYNFLKYTRK